MRTETVRVDIEGSYRDAIALAASVLSGGGLVAFPTETVYGVAANAAIPEALSRLRQVKNRPDEKPFTVHVGDPGVLDRFVPAPSVLGRRLASKGWPGPLTLIFDVEDPLQAPVMKDLGPGQEGRLYHEGTIGLRCPDNKAAHDLLTSVTSPVVAASANPAGEAPAVNGRQAIEYLDGQVDLILDGGRARYSKPSTIVRVDNSGYRIVREGVLDARMVSRLTTTNFLFVCSGNTCRSPIAEGLCKMVLAERLGCRIEDLPSKGYQVISAGVHGFNRSPASSEAVEACRRRGVDISSHRGQVLTAELIHAADYVFGMTDHHVEAIHDLSPSAKARIDRLNPEGDVEDPLGGNVVLYMQLADTMEKLIRRRLEDVKI